MVFLTYLLVGDLLGTEIEHFKVQVKLLHLYNTSQLILKFLK